MTPGRGLRFSNAALGEWHSRLPEVGNGFPRDGTDGEWKIAGRDAILTMKDGITKLATGEGDKTYPGATVTSPYFTALRDALPHWGRGAAPPD